MNPLVMWAVGYICAISSCLVGAGISYFRGATQTTVVFCERDAGGELRCPPGYERFEEPGGEGGAPAAGERQR